MKQTFSTDILVIGSGAGGAAAAGALAAAGRKVLVVEAGSGTGWPSGHGRNMDPSEAGLAAFGQLQEKHLVWPSNEDSEPSGLGGAKVAHVLGGMLSLWTNNCPWPHTDELPAWDEHSVWDRYLHRTKKLLNVVDDYWSGVRMDLLLERVARAVGPMPEGRGVQTMPVAAVPDETGLRFTSYKDLLAPGMDGDLTIMTDLAVCGIRHRAGRVQGVIATSTTDGKTVEISAETVIVAAGTIGSAKILASSGIDAGPALGRGIFDHAAFVSRVPLSDEITRAVPKDDGNFTIWIPYSPEHPWHCQICRFPSVPTPAVPDVSENMTADMFTWIPVDINPENRIIFDAENPDKFGLPSISGAFKLSENDNARATRGMSEHYLVAAEIGDLTKGWYPAFYKPGESTHLMGSCRMGPADDGTSVVDKTGRVWAYENMYVAGNAVLSRTNGGNPTMLCIAAALRTADTIMSSAK